MLTASSFLPVQMLICFAGLIFDPPDGWIELQVESHQGVSVYDSPDGVVRLSITEHPAILTTADPSKFVRGVIAGLEESGYQHPKVESTKIGEYHAKHFVGELAGDHESKVLFDSFLVLTTESATNISILVDSADGTRESSRGLLERFSFSGESINLDSLKPAGGPDDPYNEGRRLGRAFGWLIIPIVALILFRVLRRRRAS